MLSKIFDDMWQVMLDVPPLLCMLLMVEVSEAFAVVDVVSGGGAHKVLEIRTCACWKLAFLRACVPVT